MDKNILCVDGCNPIFQNITGFRKLDWSADSLMENAELISTIRRYPLSVDRATAEKDERYLQIIPYLILEKIWKGQRSSIFIYERTKKGNENRLYNNFSVGIGGHVPYDNFDDPFKSITTNIKKELFEEFAIAGGDEIWYNPETFNFPIPVVGVIRDTSNEVGRVHLGLVFKCVVPKQVLLYEEEEKVDVVGFVSIDTLKKYYQTRLENWSLLSLEGLF